MTPSTPSSTDVTPAQRLTAILREITGGEWELDASPDWPVHFTHPGTARQLTVYPERRNGRIAFIVEQKDAPFRMSAASYTPDTTGHRDLNDWLAHADLAAQSDAVAVILLRLIEQPLPAPAATRTDPTEYAVQQLATQSRELARLTAQFAAGLVRGEPVADSASRIATLAQRTAQSATRVDELRGKRQDTASTAA